MLNFLKKWRKKAAGNKPPKIQLVDLEGQPLQPGDRVMSLRFEMGECILEAAEKGFYQYRSEATQETISFLKMIDASTQRQKVRKLS